MANTGISIALAGVYQVDGAWSAVSEGFQKAAEGTDLTSHYLWTECRSGRAFLTVITREKEILGASVFRFEDWPSGTRLRCVILYGHEMKSWGSELRTFAEELARAGGAKAIVAGGRMGFERVFPDATVTRQEYEKEI